MWIAAGGSRDSRTGHEEAAAGETVRAKDSRPSAMRRYRKLDTERMNLYGRRRPRTWRDAIGATCHMPTESERRHAEIVRGMMSLPTWIGNEQAFSVGNIIHVPQFSRRGIDVID